MSNEFDYTVVNTIEVTRTVRIREWIQDGQPIYDWEDNDGGTSSEWFTTRENAEQDARH